MRKLFTIAIFAILLASCSSDDGVGSYAISGTPEITSIQGGYKRAVATWNTNTTSDDASLSNIYWDGGNSSTGQYLSATDGNSVTVEITGLSEGEHTFYVQNATPTSNKYSAPSASVTVYVYGDSYCATLAQRTISSVDYLDDGVDGAGAYVVWNSFTNSDGAIGNKLYYCNQSNIDTELFCPIGDDKSLVVDAIVETEFEYATLYQPSGCIDTLASSVVSGGSFPMSTDGIIRVASIIAMQPYFKMDNVHVVLEKGDYTVTVADVNAGYFQAFGPHVEGATEEIVDSSGEVTFEETGESKISTTEFPHSIFLCEGDNSTYDFGGSTVTISIGAYNQTGYESFPLRFLGNGNTVKNLTQIDDGELEFIISNGVTNVVMDGADNLLENVEIQSRGSYPYRYGELFGKGSGYIIKHFKHCAVLVRGDRNHVLNCTILHRCFGHYLFMQGAQNPIIEGLHVEGEMQTAQAVWAEKGTGSPADLVNFETVFPAGDNTDDGLTVDQILDYTFCLGEDGIRAYNSGNTIIDGVPYASRRTESITVKDCYVKNARAGVSLSLAGGDSYSNSVTNTTVVGCDRNFAVGGSTRIVNCAGDAQYGPCYGVDYEKNGSIEVDITLMPNQSDTEIGGYTTQNGSKQVTFIQGSNHKMVFRKDADLVEDLSLYIQVGGDNTAMSSSKTTEEGVASGCTIVNYTNYPVQLADVKSSDGSTPMSKNNTIYTDAVVYNIRNGIIASGSTDSNGNTVKPLSAWSGSF